MMFSAAITAMRSAPITLPLLLISRVYNYYMMKENY